MRQEGARFRFFLHLARVRVGHVWRLRSRGAPLLLLLLLLLYILSSHLQPADPPMIARPVLSLRLHCSRSSDGASHTSSRQNHRTMGKTRSKQSLSLIPLPY